MDVIVQNLAVLEQSISDSLLKRQILPALILIYAGIDIVASLERRRGDPVQATFCRWVDSYMLPNRDLECTALELYAARCGLVHTLTPISDLSRQGRARTISYAWGNASQTDLKESATRLGHTNMVVVQVNDLHEALRSGLKAWANEVAGDAERQKVVKANHPAWFMNLSASKIREFLAVSKA